MLYYFTYICFYAKTTPEDAVVLPIDSHLFQRFGLTIRVWKASPSWQYAERILLVIESQIRFRMIECAKDWHDQGFVDTALAF